MVGELKPVETTYKGYRFRSRLEARWAVFFDALPVAWEYEKEGFDTGFSGWYLPDFWIGDWKMWVEIKPADPEGGYLIKPSALAFEQGQNVLMIYGSPWRGEHRLELLTPKSVEQYDIFSRCRRCDGLNLSVGTDGDEGFSPIGTHTCKDNEAWPADFLDREYGAARSARFEHGENANQRPSLPPRTKQNPTPILSREAKRLIAIMEQDDEPEPSCVDSSGRWTGHPDCACVSCRWQNGEIETPDGMPPGYFERHGKP